VGAGIGREEVEDLAVTGAVVTVMVGVVVLIVVGPAVVVVVGRVPLELTEVNAIYLVNSLVLGNYYLGSSHVLLRGQRQLQALDTFPSFTDAYEDM